MRAIEIHGRILLHINHRQIPDTERNKTIAPKRLQGFSKSQNRKKTTTKFKLPLRRYVAGTERTARHVVEPDCWEEVKDAEKKIVFIVEGIDTVHCLNCVLWEAGLKSAVATTIQISAKDISFWKEYVTLYPVIAEKEIRILPHYDKNGVDYARTAAMFILQAYPSADVKIVELPDLPEDGGFKEWNTMMKANDKDAHAIIEALQELCKKAKQLKTVSGAKMWEPVKPPKLATKKSATKKSTTETNKANFRLEGWDAVEAEIAARNKAAQNKVAIDDEEWDDEE